MWKSNYIFIIKSYPKPKFISKYCNSLWRNNLRGERRFGKHLSLCCPRDKKNYGKLANLHIENEDGQKQIQSGFICDSFKVAKVSNLKMSWWGWKKALAEKYSLSDRTLAMLEEEYQCVLEKIDMKLHEKMESSKQWYLGGKSYFEFILFSSLQNITLLFFFVDLDFP